MYINAVTRSDRPVEEADAYLTSIPAIASLKRLEFHVPVTFFVGENGSGKSTLLEAIAVQYGFNAEGGTKNFNFSTAETHSGLWDMIRLHRGPYRPKGGFFLRAESFYNVASEVDRLAREVPDDFLCAYGGRSLHRQSHGESFLALLMNRFRGNGLYLLDEPEAALSPRGQMAALTRIHQLVEQNAQFLIATHSPILMTCPGAEIYLLGGEKIRSVSYQETEHYQLTRRFLENPQRMLELLLEE